MTMVDPGRHPQTVSLSLEVQEGPRYRVDSIVIGGDRALEADQIRSIVPFQPGSFLDMSKVHAAALAIQKLYRANGFLKVTILPTVRMLTGLRVSVNFEIREGPQSP